MGAAQQDKQILIMLGQLTGDVRALVDGRKEQISLHERASEQITRLREDFAPVRKTVERIEPIVAKLEVQQAKDAGAAKLKRTVHGTVSGLVGGLLAGLGTFFFTGHR